MLHGDRGADDGGIRDAGPRGGTLDRGSRPHDRARAHESDAGNEALQDARLVVTVRWDGKNQQNPATRDADQRERAEADGVFLVFLLEADADLREVLPHNGQDEFVRP